MRRGLASGIVTALVAASLAGGAFWFIGERKEQAQAEIARQRQAETPAKVAVEDGQTIVKLDAAAQQRGGIAVAHVEAAPYRSERRAYAVVLDAKGLNELAGAYAGAKAQRQSAQAKIEATRTAFERAKSLYKDQQNVSAAQLQSAEAAFHADEAALAAAEMQARSYAATARQEWGPVIGDALISGSPAASRLIEREDLLVQVTLPPGRAIAKPPQSAVVQAPQGGRVALSYVSPATRTDPRIQGMSFFYVASGQSGLLPGMNLVALLPEDAVRQGELVPDTAVVRWQGKDWVYVRTSAESFTRHEIAGEVPAAAGGYVVGNLPGDAEIVTEGAQVLLSEELRPQLQGGDDD
jgi:hypothetical protein